MQSSSYRFLSFLLWTDGMQVVVYKMFRGQSGKFLAFPLEMGLVSVVKHGNIVRDAFCFMGLLHHRMQSRLKACDTGKHFRSIAQCFREHPVEVAFGIAERFCHFADFQFSVGGCH